MPEQSNVVAEAVERIHESRKMDDTWGVSRKQRAPVKVLVIGMCAAAREQAAVDIARGSGLEFERADLSVVVGRSTGETERHLDHLFGDAERRDAVLFFDGADALFGEDAEYRDDRHDHVNPETLLQRIESFAGVVVLGARLRGHFSEVFIGGMHFVVEANHAAA